MRYGAPAIWTIAALSAFAQQTPGTLGNITSPVPVTIDGAQMAPVTPAWPVVTHDEVEMGTAPALFTGTEGNRIIFDAGSKARFSVTEGNQTYVYVLSGGVAFETVARRLYLCVGNRLFIPQTPAKGSVRLDPSRGLIRRMTAGVFIEEGSRGCGEQGPTGLLTGLPGGVPGAAGGIAAGTAGGGISGVSVAAAAGIAAAAGVAVGTAAAAGLGTATSIADCTGASGCNFNPAPLSVSAP